VSLCDVTQHKVSAVTRRKVIVGEMFSLGKSALCSQVKNGNIATQF